MKTLILFLCLIFTIPAFSNETLVCKIKDNQYPFVGVIEGNNLLSLTRTFNGKQLDYLTHLAAVANSARYPELTLNFKFKTSIEEQRIEDDSFGSSVEDVIFIIDRATKHGSVKLVSKNSTFLADFFCSKVEPNGILDNTHASSSVSDNKSKEVISKDKNNAQLPRNPRGANTAK